MAELAENISTQEVLNLIPQQPPFRFVDSITEISEAHVRGSYRFKKDEYFYAGHFPEKPVTPGVVLVECIAQIGMVSLGIYLAGREAIQKGLGLFVFTDADVEFHSIVDPDTEVQVSSKKVFYRKRKLKVEAEMTFNDGRLIASGVLSGMNVSKT